MFGMGSGTNVSHALGAKNEKLASQFVATGFFSAFGAGVIIAILGNLCLDPLVRFLGATETIAPYARDYAAYIFYGAPFMMCSLAMNNLLRFEGLAAYGMVGITAGAVLNIGLDPLLIFTCGMGVSGAAVATIVSQFAGFCLLLLGCRRGGNLPIRLSRFRPTRRYLSLIVQGGLPSLGRQTLNSVGAIVLNHAAGAYGDAAIAAMTVVNRAMMMANSAMIGFGQGFQPVCGFNYGAGLWHRVRRGFAFCVKASSGFLLLLSVLGFAFAPQIVALFRNDPEVIAFGSLALRLQCVTFVSLGWITLSNMLLQAIGRTGPATFLAVARQGIFLIPLLLILPGQFQALGVQMAQPIADLLTLCCAVPLQLRELRRLREESPLPETP